MLLKVKDLYRPAKAEKDNLGSIHAMMVKVPKVFKEKKESSRYPETNKCRPDSLKQLTTKLNPWSEAQRDAALIRDMCSGPFICSCCLRRGWRS